MQWLADSDVCACCCAEVLLFALVANTSIASLNLSLLINSVGFYQASDESTANSMLQAAASKGLSTCQVSNPASFYLCSQHAFLHRFY
jgi:hypothetical protein